MQVQVISQSQALREAGWSNRADPDTNLDRLREWYLLTDTYEYRGEDPEEGIAQAVSHGMIRVTMANVRS